MVMKKKGRSAAAKPKQVKKPGSRSKAASKTPAKRKPSAAFMRPMKPSELLADIVGSSPMPRTEVTRKLWVYIKRNGLQDKVNRRMINADAKLARLLAKGPDDGDDPGPHKQLDMFSLTKVISRHLK